MMWKLRLRGRIGFGAAVLLACGLPTLAASHRSEADLGTIQVLADVTLIDRQCRELAVDFGRLFRYGETHGIHATDIMPLGAKRALFDAALKHRSQTASDAILCSTIANQERATIPGVLAPR